MHTSRLALFASLVLSACGAVEPLDGGHIRGRCNTTSDAGTATICAPGQRVVCLIGTDAGNGESVALCCGSSETDEACAQSAGFTPTDASR